MLVWDLPLRLFHWSLVLTVLAAYATGAAGGLWLDWHSRLGTLTAALVVFRILWGFVGSTPARFANFFPTAARWREYFAAPESAFGHSPPASLSIFALLGLSFAIAVVGLFAHNDDIDFHGPLYDLVEAHTSEILTAWHIRWFDVLTVFIGMHLLAIAYYGAFKSRNLVTPMLTGKTRSAGKTLLPVRGGGRRCALLSASVAGLTFWSIDSGALQRWIVILQHHVAAAQ